MKDIKLKYYLRGLGIGVLVTALILGIAGNDEEAMTDAQIRERAIELGMVDADSLMLSELRESEPQLPEETENIPEESETAPEETENIPEESETSPEETENIPEESETTPEESEVIPESTADEDLKESEAVETEEITEAVTIEIRSGASSYTVSKDMEAAGLIDDAGEFDNYLCNNGYSRSIRVGTYEITVGTNEEEIAKIITGKR